MTLDEMIHAVDLAFATIPLPANLPAPDEYPEDRINERLHRHARESLSYFEIWAIIRNMNLHMLSPEAVQYYWPRFVKFATSSSPNSADFLWHILHFLAMNPPDGARSRTTLFTPEQCDTVVSFLEYVHAHRLDNSPATQNALAIWRKTPLA